MAMAMAAGAQGRERRMDTPIAPIPSIIGAQAAGSGAAVIATRMLATNEVLSLPLTTSSYSVSGIRLKVVEIRPLSGAAVKVVPLTPLIDDETS